MLWRSTSLTAPGNFRNIFVLKPSFQVHIEEAPKHNVKWRKMESTRTRLSFNCVCIFLPDQFITTVNTKLKILCEPLESSKNWIKTNRVMSSCHCTCSKTCRKDVQNNLQVLSWQKKQLHIVPWIFKVKPLTKIQMFFYYNSTCVSFC